MTQGQSYHQEVQRTGPFRTERRKGALIGFIGKVGANLPTLESHTRMETDILHQSAIVKGQTEICVKKESSRMNEKKN